MMKLRSGTTIACAILSLTIPRICGQTLPDVTQARVCISGATHNRPHPFPGLGDFIGWPGGVERMPNGELLVVFSAGYWHVSFAQPRNIESSLRQRWQDQGWPLDFSAPTGGRTMACRSTDNGRSWSEPVTVLDHPLDDGPHAILSCHDGTVLCFGTVQASWYGFEEAPQEFRQDLEGLNTQQFLMRSTDSGMTWSDPQWFKCPGDFYERAHGGRPVQLNDGSILWATYFKSRSQPYLAGAIRRSLDNGKSWQLVSTIRRPGQNVDEPAIAQLADGRLILVSRPDGAVFRSDDAGVNWINTGTTVIPAGSPKFKAPQIIVLRDGTVIVIATCRNLQAWISKDNAVTWSSALTLDGSSYGYPGSWILQPDESILLPYCASGRAPNHVYLVRFRINAARNGIELLPVAPSHSQRPVDESRRHTESLSVP